MKPVVRKIRCAVYTRKSSEDGLEQEFNSLDAQREACLAYIASQRHEGWKAVPTHYDDGGFSGRTLNRLYSDLAQPGSQHRLDTWVSDLDTRRRLYRATTGLGQSRPDRRVPSAGR